VFDVFLHNIFFAELAMNFCKLEMTRPNMMMPPTE